jgi:hypothetical protein
VLHSHPPLMRYPTMWPSLWKYNLPFSKSALFSDMMHSQYTTITHLHQLVMNFTGGHMLCVKNSCHTTNLFAGPSVQCRCHSTPTCALNSTRLTDSCMMCCMLLLL